ncbi:MAG: orotidine-5'-phosphate decarboxylase [Spirochaetes bacterium]|uniref:Orotidine-5'-phosphate decarboxylase n=1 Tax=Candidatus Ornithospirochaeta stercoripullorum TaxID=2840899 RepID=A0A9D9H4I8_9SPIO|nr:orotidine-5'-phosphate decarboxylase [Candidatus Ornithospirochaeta stercoripullorum]
MSYIDLLRESAKNSGNIVCMGLDPVLSVLPESEEPTRARLSAYFAEIFHRMRLEGISPAAFKPNIGYYSSLDNPREEDFQGSLALADILDLLENFFPGVPVILDSKRGDIARSSGNYAKEAFDCWKTDAVTVSPYMGTDSVMPFAYEGKGIYVLNRTSNPGAVDLQNIVTMDAVDEKDLYPMYIAVAHRIAYWATEHSGIGAVVGATSMKELGEIASYYAGKDIPMLIPGVGSQGGSAADVIAALKSSGYDLSLARINSSSGLTHPWKKGAAPEDWLDEVMSAIHALIEEASI